MEHLSVIISKTAPNLEPKKCKLGPEEMGAIKLITLTQISCCVTICHIQKLTYSVEDKEFDVIIIRIIEGNSSEYDATIP